jgi:aspartyl-tRNA(Asn)/glutamyl-tRNA(Gln) amidotransferase subunit B
VNLNRAGVPLVEIVTGPDMKSSEEAGAYLRTLYAIVTTIGICDGNLQEGNFRCDANVSVMPKGSKTLGTRAEIKNVNSFRFVEKAIEFEIARQIDLISSGGRVIQETRLYDADKNATFSMRSKEEAEDYRYFPDPDLIPMQLEQAWVEKIRESLPELPEQKRARFIELGLSADDAALHSLNRKLGQILDDAVKRFSVIGVDPKAGARRVASLTTEVVRIENDPKGVAPISANFSEQLADLVKMLETSELSSTGAKQVIAANWGSEESVAAVVERLGLKQVSDLSSLEPAVDQVIAANPAQVAEFKAGKDKLIGFFVGQVMKATGGKANPGVIQEMIKKKISGDGK